MASRETIGLDLITTSWTRHWSNTKDGAPTSHFGPTYGAKVMMDLSFLLPESWRER
ncbi:MAG TPA: hypothetical protein PKM72_12410 [Nitrospirales bacterium]|nr:hypothetical protein [Nitrospirales bacterium]